MTEDGSDDGVLDILGGLTESRLLTKVGLKLLKFIFSLNDEGEDEGAKGLLERQSDDIVQAICESADDPGEIADVLEDFNPEAEAYQSRDYDKYRKSFFE